MGNHQIINAKLVLCLKAWIDKIRQTIGSHVLRFQISSDWNPNYIDEPYIWFSKHKSLYYITRKCYRNYKMTTEIIKNSILSFLNIKKQQCPFTKATVPFYRITVLFYKNNSVLLQKHYPILKNSILFLLNIKKTAVSSYKNSSVLL